MRAGALRCARINGRAAEATMDPRPVHIYALLDPRTGKLRYIGKTINPRARLNQHCSPVHCRNHKAHSTHWCLGLLQQGLRPVYRTLEICPAGTPWWLREQWWIATCKRLGCPLLNRSVGGEAGGLGVHRSDEFRQRVSRALKGRPKTAATRRLMAIAATGRVLDAPARAKIADQARGRHPSAETRKKLRHARLGQTLSPAARAKVSVAQRTRKRQPWEIERLRRFGRNISDETRHRMAAAKLGRKLPLAVRRKMSASHRQRCGKCELDPRPVPTSILS